MKILIIIIGVIVVTAAAGFVFVGVSDIGPPAREIVKETTIEKINAQNAQKTGD